MGGCFSDEKKPAAFADEPTETPGGSGTISDPFAEKRAQRRAELAANPELAKYEGLKGEVRLKVPGELAGKNFAIQNCEDCDIFLMDRSSQVLIDDCKNCRIFIGPCDSSVFFRNCQDCRFVFMCGQLRTRDSKNIDLMLFCSTKPTIETTSDIRFSCFQGMSYFSLAEQLKSKDVWNNPWAEVFDFNKATGRHFTTKPLQSVWELLDRSKLEMALQDTPVDASELDLRCPVPHTTGAGTGDKAMIFCLTQAAADALADVWDQFNILRTSHLKKLSADQLKSLFGNHPDAMEKAGPDVWGMELTANGSVESIVANIPDVWCSPQPADHANTFFAELPPSDQF